jgi:hypothetical protein
MPLHVPERDALATAVGALPLALSDTDDDLARADHDADATIEALRDTAAVPVGREDAVAFAVAVLEFAAVTEVDAPEVTVLDWLVVADGEPVHSVTDSSAVPVGERPVAVTERVSVPVSVTVPVPRCADSVGVSVIDALHVGRSVDVRLFVCDRLLIWDSEFVGVVLKAAVVDADCVAVSESRTSDALIDNDMFLCDNVTESEELCRDVAIVVDTLFATEEDHIGVPESVTNRLLVCGGSSVRLKYIESVAVCVASNVDDAVSDKEALIIPVGALTLRLYVAEDEF